MAESRGCDVGGAGMEGTGALRLRGNDRLALSGRSRSRSTPGVVERIRSLSGC